MRPNRHGWKKPKEPCDAQMSPDAEYIRQNALQSRADYHVTHITNLTCPTMSNIDAMLFVIACHRTHA